MTLLLKHQDCADHPTFLRQQPLSLGLWGTDENQGGREAIFQERGHGVQQDRSQLWGSHKVSSKEDRGQQRGRVLRSNLEGGHVIPDVPRLSRRPNRWPCQRPSPGIRQEEPGSEQERERWGHLPTGQGPSAWRDRPVPQQPKGSPQKGHGPQREGGVLGPAHPSPTLVESTLLPPPGPGLYPACVPPPPPPTHQVHTHLTPRM